MLSPLPLAQTAQGLRSGEIELLRFIDELCDRIDAIEPDLQAFLPEPERRYRLRAEASALSARYPDPESRPPLYGVPVGVKDILRVAGFPTQAGSRLPAELFEGNEAACVTRLREAGALFLKTTTTEFAYFEPAPTRNPHNLAHTPGGSSSGSAAAVAAGICALALGTQTVGSVIRPASFCGIAGFKPSYGRIATAGLIYCAETLDTIGFFAQDLAGIALTAPLLCSDWQPTSKQRQPVLGVPVGPYLEQTSPAGLAAFESHLSGLEAAGYTLKRIPSFAQVEELNERHARLVSAEMALVHASWFAEYSALYRPRTAQNILAGQSVLANELTMLRTGPATLRAELSELMDQHAIDLWLAPSAMGAAPQGLSSTGSPLLNLPWTHAGMPALSLPSGYTEEGLPLGLQVVGRFGADESLLHWANELFTVIDMRD